MGSPNLSLARSFAETLARQAARITHSLVGRATVERKLDDSPVTEADHRIQRYIIDAVAENYPDHACVGEEDTEHSRSLPPPGRADYSWVVDPLDGTRNFARTFPVFATSIALMHGNEPLVAVIHEHCSGWTCSAVAGEGAICNGGPARVADKPVGRDTFIAIPSGRRHPIRPIIEAWTDRHVLRNVGSTALHLAYVAAGAVDAAVCYECKLWDVAAGLLLITEAGGRVTDLSGSEIKLPHPAEHGERDLPLFAASEVTFDRLFAEMSEHHII